MNLVIVVNYPLENLNNLVGVPLTLFRLRENHQVAVLEFGMNARGEIHRLAEIAEPDVGVITNIGEAHLEFLGSVEEVAEGIAHSGKASTQSVPTAECRRPSPSSRLRIDRFTAGIATARCGSRKNLSAVSW